MRELLSVVKTHGHSAAGGGHKTHTYTQIELAIKIEKRTAVRPDTQTLTQHLIIDKDREAHRSAPRHRH